MYSYVKVGDKIWSTTRLGKEKMWAEIIGETKTQWKCKYLEGKTFNVTKSTLMHVETGSMFHPKFWWKDKV